MNSKLIFLIKAILLAVVISGLNSPLFSEQKFFYRALTAAYTFLSTSILISILRFAILFFYGKRKNIRNKAVSNFILGINQLATILNVTFFIISVFILLGIDIKEFLTSITLIAMAVALIFREYITNMISGLIIMFSDKFEVTDYIKIGDHAGRIENMTLQNILIRNEDGDSVLIPNNAFFISNIVNKSINERGSFVIDFQLPFENEKNYEFIENEMHNFFKSYKELDQIKGIRLNISKINFEYIQYKIIVEYEYESGIDFSKIKSDFLKYILTQVK